MIETTSEPKRRGRKPGVKYGPQAGSRPWQIARLMPGERILLEAPAGRLQAFMSQVAVDIGRCGLNGRVSQAHFLGVAPGTREVIDIVAITRLPDDTP